MTYDISSVVFHTTQQHSKFEIPHCLFVIAVDIDCGMENWPYRIKLKKNNEEIQDFFISNQSHTWRPQKPFAMDGKKLMIEIFNLSNNGHKTTVMVRYIKAKNGFELAKALAKSKRTPIQTLDPDLFSAP